MFTSPVWRRIGTSPVLRHVRYNSSANHAKYADKIRQRAADKGISVEELKAAAVKSLKDEAVKKAPAFKSPQVPSLKPTSPKVQPPPENIRKDASPVRPLSSIFALEKILSTPHTVEQISKLWISYHSLRSDGTGKGFVSAAIPVDKYEKMASVASHYPSLVVPLPRPRDSEASSEQQPYEFYFVQWSFHESPPVPTASEGDLFSKPSSTGSPAKQNPPISAVLFTPLQEYKLRGSFATPYLVLTHYTDLSATHGIVLMRGEVTPSTSGEGQNMLKQEDAQYLAVALQKFFLWDQNSGDREGQRLLKQFHENPSQFTWEDLIKYSHL